MSELQPTGSWDLLGCINITMLSKTKFIVTSMQKHEAPLKAKVLVLREFIVWGTTGKHALL